MLLQSCGESSSGERVNTLIIKCTSAFNYQCIDYGLHFHNIGFQRWLVLKHLHLTIYKHVQREADSASKILCTTKYICSCEKCGV